MGMPTLRGTWARISWHPPDDILAREFSGLESSISVRGVPKPDFIQSIHWEHSGFICRAEEMTFIDQPAISDNYAPDRAPLVTEDWWISLSTSLDNLAKTKTGRVSLTQEDIDRSITEAFAATVDTTISCWVIGHGDLHWANLTSPRLFLLDWDSWGRMPKGLDAAKLWESSYRVPALADEVAKRFAADLTTRDGMLANLWVCANRVLGARKRGVFTDQSARVQNRRASASRTGYMNLPASLNRHPHPRHPSPRKPFIHSI